MYTYIKYDYVARCSPRHVEGKNKKKDVEASPTADVWLCTIYCFLSMSTSLFYTHTPEPAHACSCCSGAAFFCFNAGGSLPTTHPKEARFFPSSRRATDLIWEAAARGRRILVLRWVSVSLARRGD